MIKTIRLGLEEREIQEIDGYIKILVEKSDPEIEKHAAYNRLYKMIEYLMNRSYELGQNDEHSRSKESKGWQRVGS